MSSWIFLSFAFVSIERSTLICRQISLFLCVLIRLTRWKGNTFKRRWKEVDGFFVRIGFWYDCVHYNSIKSYSVVANSKSPFVLKSQRNAKAYGEKKGARTRDQHKISSYFAWMANRASVDQILCKPSLSLHSITLIVYYPFFVRATRFIPCAFLQAKNMAFSCFTFAFSNANSAAGSAHIHKTARNILTHSFHSNCVAVVGFLQHSHIMIINSISQTFPASFFFRSSTVCVRPSSFADSFSCRGEQCATMTRFMVELFILVYS